MEKLAHLQIDMRGCRTDLDDIGMVMEMMEKVCTVLHLDIREHIHHKFNPQGLTVVFIIAESHISYHSWPEHKSCFIDVFTCGDIPPEESIPVFKEYTHPEKVVTRTIYRHTR